jgi:hypothetical protein
MLVARVIFLAVLVCLHVVGGAVLFRRLFPRESPWWGFFLPTLVLVSLLNFIEHIVALPMLEIALPFSSLGLIVLLASSRAGWKELRVPAALFVAIFAFCLWIRCLQPDVNFYNTEGLTDLNRILDFCLGDTVPPQDCWLPPYPHTGYYTFLHYGASVLKRLLFVDIGTAYNLSSALANSLSLLAAAAAAFTLGRFRPWVATLTLLTMAGGFTGSTPIDLFVHPDHPNPAGSIDIGSGTASSYPEFEPLLRISSPYAAYRIYTPGCYIYYSEFHANIGGHLVALLTVFGGAELLRRRRAFFPWIWLAVAPVMAFITCTWFVFMVTLLAVPSLLWAWALGRRPPRWKWALLGAAIGVLLLVPDMCSLIQNSMAQPYHHSKTFLRDIVTISIQWWPVYLPWIALCFRRMDLSVGARWLHLWLVPIALSVELFYISDRGTTMEKTLGGAFGIGQAVLYPLLFVQRGSLYRGLSFVVVASGLLSASAWATTCAENVDWNHLFCRLQGDYYLALVPSENRIKQALQGMHGQTVLAGRARHAWFKSPTVVAFTENRCYLGWTNAEEAAGRGVEANKREREIKTFYDGTMPHSLDFLENTGISAVLVWPEDKMSDAWLDEMKTTLSPKFQYVDCRIAGHENAGVFLKTP